MLGRQHERESGHGRKTHLEIVILFAGQGGRVKVFDKLGDEFALVGLGEGLAVDVLFLYEPGAELAVELGRNAGMHHVSRGAEEDGLYSTSLTRFLK